MCHGHLDYLQKPPLACRPSTKLGDHGTLNAHNCWFNLFYHVWGPAWIEIHWNSIWLRAWSDMTSHYTWRSMTMLHDFGGVLGQPLDTFFWALTISWSRLLARVWSGPNLPTFLLTPSIILCPHCPFREKGSPTCSFNNGRHVTYTWRNSSKFQVERWGKWA